MGFGFPKNKGALP